MKKVLIGCGVVFGLFIAGVILILVLAAFSGNLKVNTEFKVNKGANYHKEFVKDEKTPVDSKIVKVMAKKEIKEIDEFVDDYFDEINDGNDKYIYENIYHPGFKDSYTLEKITDIHNLIRTNGGKIKSYDLDKAKISIKIDKNGAVYEIEMPIEMEKEPVVNCKLKTLKDKNGLRITYFNFKS